MEYCPTFFENFIHVKGLLIKKFEYLRENEFLRVTILICLSGAQVEMLKNIVTPPLYCKCARESEIMKPPLPQTIV